MNTNYGFGSVVDLPFDAAIERVTAELADEGFGILTEIDVQATLKKKLDKEMPAYRILGACNPALASQAIDAEPEIGLLLPCNVLVREDAAGDVHVSFMDPRSILSLVGREEINPLADQVREKLERVLGRLTRPAAATA